MFHDVELNRAVNRCYGLQVAVDHVKAVFGERISDRPDLVKFTQPLRGPFWRHRLLSYPLRLSDVPPLDERAALRTIELALAQEGFARIWSGSLPALCRAARAPRPRSRCVHREACRQSRTKAGPHISAVFGCPDRSHLGMTKGLLPRAFHDLSVLQGRQQEVGYRLSNRDNINMMVRSQHFGPTGKLLIGSLNAEPMPAH